jgi:hypothetical protein
VFLSSVSENITIVLEAKEEALEEMVVEIVVGEAAHFMESLIVKEAPTIPRVLEDPLMEEDEKIQIDHPLEDLEGIADR